MAILKFLQVYSFTEPTHDISYRNEADGGDDARFSLIIDGGNIAVLEHGEGTVPTPGRLRDKFGRAITDLRVSVTDRCNYKCVYCRTGNEGALYTELAIADYLRMVRLFVSLGVEKIRLTGASRCCGRAGGDGAGTGGDANGLSAGWELRGGAGGCRSNCADHEWTFVGGMAEPLKDAGLNRVTVSMDAVDAETFAAITRVPRSLTGCWRAFAKQGGGAGAGEGELRAAARIQ